MFYENQPIANRDNYKKMLSIIGNLTLLFSESDCPYLPYRAHENIFCRYLQAENLARKDCSADAKKDKIGIGLKTWVGKDDQKVAEFGLLRETFAGLTGMDLVRKIAEYRNERIRVTMNLHGIDTMIYHIVKRVPGTMQILEHTFDYIDIDNLSIIEDRGNVNNTYFSDGHHIYHFSSSKNTLYMIFEDMELLDSFEVEIMDDPYSFLMHLMYGDEPVDLDPSLVEATISTEQPKLPQLCLRLYSSRADGRKFVAEQSGLNQWNGIRTSNYKRADGTWVHRESKRDENELYIPYLVDDRMRDPDFFPPRDTDFRLRLPDGQVISAKVCQAAHKKMPDSQYQLLSAAEKEIEDRRRNEGKSIMSNPNNALGEWLLRTVFELPVGTVVTYEMLQKFGVDSVVFTKHGEFDYSVDFSEIGTYEAFYGEENQEEQQ